MRIDKIEIPPICVADVHGSEKETYLFKPQCNWVGSCQKQKNKYLAKFPYKINTHCLALLFSQIKPKASWLNALIDVKMVYMLLSFKWITFFFLQIRHK